MNKNRIEGWKPGDDIVLRYMDKTGDERTSQQTFEMLRAIGPIMAEHGFGFRSIETWQQTQITVLGELSVMVRNEDDDDDA